MGDELESNSAQFQQAVLGDDIRTVTSLLETASLTECLDGCGFKWGMPAVAAARSRGMVDLLLEHGAAIEKVTEWWKAGFGAGEMERGMAEYLMELGATISPHAAAGIGLVGVLKNLLNDDSSLVRLKGGDGCEPLHFAGSVEVAELLFEHDADLDARDEDHDSTPAQWRIKDAPEVVRFLIERGGTPDIFMAAGLGDAGLARQLIGEDPDCTTVRIGHNDGSFPGIGFKGRGGTIYQWTLGFNLSPHEVALKHGYRAVYDLLMEHTPPRQKLLVACTSANRPLAESIVAAHPGIVDELDAEDRTLLAKFCWETNIDIDAVRLMLDLGVPIDVPEPNHGFMALHNAAWCGDPALVELLLERGHPVDPRDPNFNATALGFAVHSCTEAKRHPDGDFELVVRLLLEGGVPFDKSAFPVGHEGIDGVVDRFLNRA